MGVARRNRRGDKRLANTGFGRCEQPARTSTAGAGRELSETAATGGLERGFDATADKSVPANRFGGERGPASQRTGSEGCERARLRL